MAAADSRWVRATAGGGTGVVGGTACGATKFRGGDPACRPAGRARSTTRIAPSAFDPLACGESGSSKRHARLSPVHADAAARTGGGAGTRDARAFREAAEGGADRATAHRS